jgi:glycogen operon protein
MLEFTLPPERWGQPWVAVLDTFRGWLDDAPPLQAGARLKVEPRSMVVLRRED